MRKSIYDFEFQKFQLVIWNTQNISSMLHTKITSEHAHKQSDIYKNM